MSPVSSKQYETIDDMAQQLANLSEVLQLNRPKQAAIFAAVSEMILNSCRPSEKQLCLKIPEGIGAINIGSAVIFQLN